MYQVTITRSDPNPEYEAWEKKESRYYNQPIPSARINVRVMEVELTDEEFQAVKKAALEIM
jgi:hypothetical protein